ncbi:hypothetical protein ACHAW5_003305 [Stephanodiscus triporus]|uniref:AB hydrolase-1 domain-containing protein n=1 Tax=Stephanodiscus triporus TaxID=2934178 RepID=A0ABD3QDI6_9STRA
MGDTISSLVFRPPKPTPIHPADYFYIDVDVHSPLCTNRIHFHNKDEQPHGGCFVGSTMCLETGESDLASLDTSFINGEVCTSPLNANEVQDVVPNVRNGQVYRVPAFFIRRRNATQTILFSHGNAEDLGMMYPRMKDLAMLFGVNILAYDYTGYGLSIPGPLHRNCPNGGGGGGNDGNGSSNEGPSENMIYRNIEAAYRYLTRVRKIPPHKIILYGRSLGSGPACYLAAKTSLSGNPVGGLILHSPFLSVYKVVADLNGLDLGMVGDLFHNEKRARNVRCPTLIIHGRDDEVVPFWHAPRLLAAIPPEFRAQPYYVDGMGHNHIESRCRERYVKVVLNFLTMGACNENLYGSNPTVVAHRGPTPVPINERASHNETGENPTFYVNKTWLRHAKVLLRDVFSDLNAGIEQLVSKVLAENNSARSIWNSVDIALKKGYKTLDAKAKQVVKLQDDLTKTKTRLENALEKVRGESNKRESAIREKKEALESLQTKTESLTKTKKDLVDVRKELDDLKKEVGGSNWSDGQKATVQSSDELERLRERKRIENEAYATRLKLQREDKERGEKRKRKKKNESVSTIQGIGGGCY